MDKSNARVSKEQEKRVKQAIDSLFSIIYDMLKSVELPPENVTSLNKLEERLEVHVPCKFQPLARGWSLAGDTTGVKPP